jgi:hypothetical protein
VNEGAMQNRDFGTDSGRVPDCKGIIDKVWQAKKQHLTDEMRNRLDSGDIYVLYDMQLYTGNLLRYAFQQGEHRMMDDLSHLFLLAYDSLQTDAAGSKRWVFTDPSNKEFSSLLNKEIPLISSQFLCAVSESIHYSLLPEETRVSPAMRQLALKYVPVLTDFYDRWLPSFSDWMLKAHDAPFPPADDVFTFDVPVSDDLLFLLAGMTRLLAAGKKAPESFGITEKQTEAYRKFIGMGCRLLEKRLTPSNLKDFDGNSVIGMNFDLGVWDGYEDYAFSGCEGETYPTGQQQLAAQDVGWDISHARRFVNVFDALYDCKDVTGADFPGEGVMKGLANQLAYGVFNGDFDKPLFANFMDGTNGWFRVGYAGREHFGYPPYGLSDSVPTGGYGFWNRFNGDIGRIMQGICMMLQKGRAGDLCRTSEGEEDASLLHGEADHCLNSFIERYYGDFTNPDSLGMLMFLPAMVSP